MHPLLLTASAETFVNFHRVFLFFQQVTKYRITAGALGTQTGKWRSDAAVIGSQGKIKIKAADKKVLKRAKK